MARLRLFLALLLISLTQPAHAQVYRWRGHIEEASARFGIPVVWIERVMQAESGGRTHLRGRPITSRAGAMGLMQLMPGTWAELRARYRLGDDPFDPRTNILGGAAYLRMMHDRFGYPGLFAAYNAGPARYAAYLTGRSSLPLETSTYLILTAGMTQARSSAAALPIRGRPATMTMALAPPQSRDRLFALDYRRDRTDN